jgi:cell division transport system permease protein
VISLRPTGFDELGLRRALSDRMLPLLVAAMAFLAALALAGWFGTAALSRHWQQGAGASLTVQVPQATDPAAHGGQTRLAAVLALLTGTPGVASAHALSDQELADLLKPWLGQGADRLAIPIPAVIAVRLTDTQADLAPLTRRLIDAAPGTLVEDHGLWIRRLAVLAKSLQACAGLALLLVAGVAAAVIAVATRAGLSTRRQAIEIVHGLGATDSYIAGRFAARATLLAATGAAGGAVVALPVLLALAQMAAPFLGETGRTGDTLPDALGALPVALWLALPCLPVGAAAIGFATAHNAVRRWLRRLP